MDFVGIDVTEKWSWANVDPMVARTGLNKWIKKRGDAVHRSRIEQNGPHLAKRDELDKCVRFFKELVEATESALSEV